MRTHLVVIAGLAFTAASCRTSQAARASGGSPGRTVEGRVEEVGREDGTVTLRVGKEQRQVLVAPEAEIRIDDFKATFDDLQEGQRVRAALDESKERPEGFRIQILDHGVAAPAEVREPGKGAAASPSAERGSDAR